MSATIARWRRLAVTGVVAGGLVAGSALAGVPAQAATVKNLVSNGSAESVARGVPAGWTKGGGGVNTRVLTSAAGGAQNGKRFNRVLVSNYRSGGAWWLSPVAAVRGGTAYTFTEYYRSNRPTKVNAYFTVGRKTVGVQLGAVPASGRWQAATFKVAAPAGATRVRFGHALSAQGFLDVDNLTLAVAVTAPAKPAPAKPTPAKPTPAPEPSKSTRPSSSGLVSLTFDDGWTNQYTNAFLIMKAAGNMPGTFYLISNYLGSGSYMSVAQAKEIQAAGSEIGSHTVDHKNLTTLSDSELTAELANSKSKLEANFGPVTSLAYPYGGGNSKVQAEAAKYYSSSRSTASGLNVKGQYNPQSLTIGYVLNTTPLSTVQGWIDDAKAKNAWLILCYHEVADGKAGDTYTVSVSTFSSHVSAIKNSGIKVVTVRDGLAATR